MREKKPRLFASPLSDRVYVVFGYKEVKPGVFEATGKKYDVTDDFMALVKSLSEQQGRE